MRAESAINALEAAYQGIGAVADVVVLVFSNEVQVVTHGKLVPTLHHTVDSSVTGRMTDCFSEHVPSDSSRFMSSFASLRCLVPVSACLQYHNHLHSLFARVHKVFQAGASPRTIGEYECDKPLLVSYHRHEFSLGAHYNAVVPM
eukprot:m.187840 g.187840  ORF g.187840 m.187840 type:complete len:145 (-) comp18513_c0_seq2:249-683(-)